MQAPEPSKNRILKSAGRVGMATTLSRIFGYFRDASLAWVLGAGLGMDAFTVAFRLANLFRRLVAEGAMSTAFVPVFVQFRTEHSHDELWDFARKFFYTMALAAGFIVALEIALAPVLVRIMAPGFTEAPQKLELTIWLTRLMAPYLFFVSLAAFVMGILNSLGRFGLPALSPVFFNASVIFSAFTFAGRWSEPTVAIAFGVLLGGALQLASQIPAAARLGMRFRPGFSFSHPAVKRIGSLLLPSVFGVGIVQLNLLVDSLMASFLREGSVSHLYYADRVLELVLGVFVMSLATVILPGMAADAAKRKIEEVKGTLLFSIRTILFVAVPATVGLVVLADPIVHVLFERGRFSGLDTERTAAALAFYALGLCSIAMMRILVSAFYATQDPRTPVRVGFIALIANAVLNWLLMHPLKQGGIALATSIASVVSVIQLLAVFQKRYGALDWRSFRPAFVKIAVASCVMGAVGLAALGGLRFQAADPAVWKTAKLFVTIGASAAFYFGLCYLLRVKEVRNIFGNRTKGEGAA